MCMGADGAGIVVARFGIEDFAIGSPTPIPAAGGSRGVDPAHPGRRRRPEGDRHRRETETEEFLYLHALSFEIGHVCFPPDGRIAQTGLLEFKSSRGPWYPAGGTVHRWAPHNRTRARSSAVLVASRALD